MTAHSVLEAIAVASELHERAAVVAASLTDAWNESPDGSDAIDVLFALAASAEKMLSDAMGGTGCIVLTTETVAERIASLKVPS